MAVAVVFLVFLFLFPSVFFVQTIICSAFSPADVFLIDCGGSNPIEVDDSRVFQPDNRVRNLKLSPSSGIVVSGDGISSSLYNSARVFEETSVYVIKTRQVGRHWLRLHLFPVQNTRYNLRSGVFSVVANGITLHRFSFAESGLNSPMVKEYVIEIGDSGSRNLELKFSPGNGSVAFVNGIEVVAVPDTNFPSGVVPVPLGPEVEIRKHVAFETAFRINMGGPLLTPKNDSMWRTWEPDQAYLVNAASANSVKVNPNLIKYIDGIGRNCSNSVYATAQEMAEANVTDQRFNISWIFEVDEGFTYLIRLHICDIVSAALNSLIFNVYINKQAALTSFDISSKTMALSAAYYADFVTNVSMGSNQILVQVGPPDLRNLPSNAILNGLEIMKMSNPCDSLDGNVCVIHKNSKFPRRKLIVLAISSAAVFVVLSVVVAAVSLHLHGGRSLNVAPLAGFLSRRMLEIRIRKFRFAALLPPHNLTVYKGVLESGVMVAVKRGNPGSRQGLTEFRTEILMLSRLRHRHLVSLIGYCEEQNEMILVYEFMAGGPTMDQTHVSTAVKGSFGYLDPEYFRRQQLTEKSDVYSFGVVLMEILCARPAINPALPREQVNIAEWESSAKRPKNAWRNMEPRGLQWEMCYGIWSMVFNYKRLQYKMNHQTTVQIIFRKSLDGSPKSNRSTPIDSTLSAIKRLPMQRQQVMFFTDYGS
ncbi:dof zinc finger protein DOF3.6-like [Hibiscus syriacus]|uniref:Dof zinc finger protein DOF3.6-like n=1 Tax=Hibiscus syriacus TaxID=106335 RepID=A0A6A2X6G4_HIBSY|nr:dof zinc finger protein DOF3.6-like [Hibiscus syriacus]